MFLINAIYFKGDWTVKFNPSDTHDQPFTLADGSTVTVPLMYRTDDELRHYEDADVIAVDVPYGNGLYSMTAVMPRHGSLDSLAASLRPDRWNHWISSMTTAEGRVYLPRFTTRYEAALKDVLSDLGMGLAFSDDADFSGIRSAGGLKISEVRHKTFVQVDEEGTEAAAATSVEVGTTSVQDPFIFRADRPFIFAIRERHSGTILFIGRIMNPTDEGNG
jgi:serpin B